MGYSPGHYLEWDIPDQSTRIKQWQYLEWNILHDPFPVDFFKGTSDQGQESAGHVLI